MEFPCDKNMPIESKEKFYTFVLEIKLFSLVPGHMFSFFGNYDQGQKNR